MAKNEINLGMYSLQRKYSTTPITFNEDKEVNYIYKDPLIMIMRVRPCEFCHILVDIGSLIDLLFLSMLHILGMHKEDILKRKCP